MLKKVNKVSNPLTIIAIFAGLAEINGTVVVALLPTEIQVIFLWFIIIFPILLVVLFFLTLNFNPKVIYAPSDFTNEDNFLKTMNVESQKFESGQISLVEKGKIVEKTPDLQSKIELLNYGNELFPKETKAQLKAGNKFTDLLMNKLKQNFDDKVFEWFSYGIQAPEYFTLNYSYSSDHFHNKQQTEISNVIIIKVTKQDDDIKFIAIGKDLISSDIYDFTEKIFNYIQDQIDHIFQITKREKNEKQDK